MKFSEMPYARPDTETVKKQLTKPVSYTHLTLPTN